MKKTLLNKYDLFSILLCLVAIVPGVLVYDRLPEQIATHFGVSGDPDGYSGRSFTVFMIPLIFTLIQMTGCIINNLIRRKERREKEERTGRADQLIRFLPPMLLYMAEIAILMYAMGKLGSVLTILGLLETGVLILLGNYMPKLRRNVTLGIRTWRTLADPEIWDRTHRFSGRLYMISGFFVFLVTVLEMGVFPLIVVVVVTILFPFIYSELLYIHKKSGNKGSSKG